MTLMHSKLMLRTFALLGVAGAIVILFLSLRGPSSFPERENLASVTGSVVWTSPDRYSIRFRVAGDSRAFTYANKSGESAVVATALTETTKQPITVLVNPGEPQHGAAGGPFFQVYEFTTSQGSLRPYAQIKEAWASDYRHGYLVALLILLAAGILEFAARKVPTRKEF